MTRGGTGRGRGASWYRRWKPAFTVTSKFHETHNDAWWCGPDISDEGDASTLRTRPAPGDVAPGSVSLPFIYCFFCARDPVGPSRARASSAGPGGDLRIRWGPRARSFPTTSRFFPRARSSSAATRPTRRSPGRSRRRHVDTGNRCRHNLRNRRHGTLGNSRPAPLRLQSQQRLRRIPGQSPD